MNPNQFTDAQIIWNASLMAIIIVGFVLVAGYVIKRFIERVSFPCAFCNTTVQSFRQLSPEARNDIHSYFREYEGREPDTSCIFVCPTCHYVYDDFSGQKQTMEHNNWGCVTFCKACTSTVSSEPESQIRCSRCDTAYRWESYGKLGLIFLKPPPNTPVVRHIPNDRIDSLQTESRAPWEPTRVRVENHRGNAEKK